MASIAVPNGNLAVQRFDATLGQMVNAQAEVHCNVQQEELYPTQVVTNCWLYVKHEIDSNSVGFFTVRYDSSVDIAIHSGRIVNMQIESDDLLLKYEREYAGEGVYFELTDKMTGESKILGFDMRYWQSFQKPDQ